MSAPPPPSTGVLRVLARRGAFYALAGWVAITLNFLIPRLMPGDPAAALFARLQGQLQPEAMAALRLTLGLSDAPLWRQYIDYIGNLAQGELGRSVAFYPAPVTEVIGSGLLWTSFLAGGSLIISFTLGAGLGALAAWRRGGWLDQLGPPLLSLIGAFPYFWVAMAAAWLLGFQAGWFPLRHAWDPGLSPSLSWTFIESVISHAVLPASTLVIASLGGWALGMRNTTIAVLGEDYIQYARARGLSPGRVFVHHALRNAALPNLTGFGMALGFVLSGALLTEIVFAYPGQGYLLITAVRAQDHPLMQGLFLTITLAVLGANFTVDALTALLDPRVRR